MKFFFIVRRKGLQRNYPKAYEPEKLITEVDCEHFFFQFQKSMVAMGIYFPTPPSVQTCHEFAEL